MKKLFILIFFIIIFSSVAFAYYATDGNYSVRFLPSPFGVDAQPGDDNSSRSNAGEYAGETFNESGYTGYFQAYDIAQDEPVPPSPAPAVTGGGGGGGAVGNIYGIYLKRLCVDENSPITISPSTGGQLIVSYEKDDKWFYIETTDVKVGRASFTPTLPGKYRFDFKIFNNVAASTQGIATVCAGSPPFSFPMGFEEMPTQLKEEQVLEDEKEKSVAVIGEKIKSKLPTLLPLAASLALVMAMIFVFKRSGEKKHKKKSFVKRLPKPFLKLKKKSSLDELDTDLSRIKSELGKLKRKYKF